MPRLLTLPTSSALPHHCAHLQQHVFHLMLADGTPQLAQLLEVRPVVQQYIQSEWQ